MVEKERKVEGSLGFKGENDIIVVGIQSLEKREEQENLLYDSTETSSILIAQDSSTFAGLDLEPELLEKYKRKIDRGILHGKAAFQFLGFKITVDKKPRKEVEEIEHAVWRKPKK